MNMIICSTQQIGIIIHDGWLFQNVSFEVHEGERAALIGRNGSGKSTLLRILNGDVTPDSGQVHRRRGTRVGMLQQIPDYPAETLVIDVLREPFQHLQVLEKRMRHLEAAMAGVDSSSLELLLQEYAECQSQYEDRGGYQAESKMAAVMQGLGIPEWMLRVSFCSLSGGEQTKIGLARLLLYEPNLLLLDEPTNHLDIHAVEWLEEYLRRYTGAVVVVSHDRYFLDKVVTKVIDLEDGEVNIYPGNYSQAMEQKETKLLLEFQAYEEQQKKIEQMKAAIKRLREWANRANPPNAGMHRRASSMQKALDKMEKLRKPNLDRRRMGLFFDTNGRSGNDVVRFDSVAKAFDGRGLFREVSFLVRYGQRVALVGENGSGKSTMLKMMLGEVEPDCGQVRMAAGLKIGYLSQHGLTGYDGYTAMDAFRDVAAMTEGQSRNVLAKFLFYGADVFKKVESLSGGERMRLRLAQMMHQDLHLLLLDEPTNHLDIDSREVLEEAIDSFDGTVFAVSHDRHFINQLFQRVLWLESERVEEYLGNYDEAKTKRQGVRPESGQVADKETELSRGSRPNPKSKPHSSYGWQSSQSPKSPQSSKVPHSAKSPQRSKHTVQELENTIQLIEGQLAELHSMMFSPDVQGNIAELGRLQQEVDKLSQQREELYSEYESQIQNS